MSELYAQLEKQLSLIARIVRDPVVLADGAVVPRSTVTLLYLLANRGPVRIGVVASDLNLDPSTVTRQVQHAARLGLVVHGRDPDDQRVRVLSLTPEGRNMLEALVSRQHRGLREVLDGWTDSDRHDLVRLLSNFNSDVNERRGQSKG